MTRPTKGKRMTAKEPTPQQIAGQLLSNIAYNMSQRKVGEPLTDTDLRALKDGYLRWDAAKRMKK